jgi:hypothetical protein
MQGMSTVLQAGVYAYYFERSHLGAINDLARTSAVARTAFGPVLFATGFDTDFGVFHVSTFGDRLNGTFVVRVCLAKLKLKLRFQKTCGHNSLIK